MVLVTYSCGVCGQGFCTDVRHFEIHMKQAHDIEIMVGHGEIWWTKSTPLVAPERADAPGEGEG